MTGEWLVPSQRGSELSNFRLSCCYIFAKKGNAMYDEWTANEGFKNDWCQVLTYFESTLDTEVGPCVWVYDL